MVIDLVDLASEHAGGIALAVASPCGHECGMDVSTRFWPVLERSWTCMKFELFYPFNAQKWLGVGFSAFLYSLSASYQSNISNFLRADWRGIYRSLLGAFQKSDAQGSEVFAALLQNSLFLQVMIGVIVGCLGVMSLVLLWFSSRGQMMLIFNVANNDPQIIRPWEQYAREANQLFIVRFGLFVLWTLFFAGLVLIVFRLGLWNAAEQTLNPPSNPDVFGIGGLVAFAAVGVGGLFLLEFIVYAFVSPVLYIKRLSAGGAIRESLNLILSRPLSFLVYVLGMMLVFLGMLFVAALVSCVLFCISWIPFVSTLIFLPLIVFTQAIPLYYISQFGAEYNVFTSEHSLLKAN